MTEPALRLVGCPECEKLHAALDATNIDLENTQADLKRARREVTRLKRDKDAERRRDPNFEVATRLFEFWQVECDHEKADWGPARQAAVLACLRLPNKEPRDIAKGILGAKYDAFEKGGEKYDDLALICRDEVKLESFIRRYERWKAAQDRRVP